MVANRNSQETDDIIFNTLAAESAKRSSYESFATPQYGQRLGEIHKNYPGLNGGVKIALAKSGFTDEQIEKIYPAAATATTSETVKPKKQKSWFERNVMDKVKTTSRYAFAAANLPVDFVQGGIAQITDENKDVDGWFISTDLGSLIANDTEAGNGFFIGGKAKELQAERARRYRGTIGTHAATNGRSLASTIFTPDTMAFNVMSGIIDAATALIVPTVPGAKQTKEAILAAEEAGKGGQIIKGAATALEKFGQGSVAINASKATKAEIEDLRKSIIAGQTVDLTAANKWFGTGQAQRVAQRAAETDNFLDVWDLFGRKIDVQLAQDMAKESNPELIKVMLMDKLGQSAGLASRKEFRGGNRTYLSLARRDQFLNSMPLGDKVSRAYAKMPQRHVNLMKAESPADQIQHLNTLDGMLKLSLVDRATQRGMMNRAAELILEKDPNKIAEFTDDLYTVLQDAVEQTGVPSDITKAVFENFKKVRDELSRFNHDENYDIADGGLYQAIHNGAADPDVSFAGAQLASEFAKHDIFIPDVRQIRRMTASKPINWIFVKSGKSGDPNIEKLRQAGQLRLPFAFVEHIQQDYWRPIITATMGNFFRNTIDSQMMIAMSHKPVSSLIRHPGEYLATMRQNTRIVDLMNEGFDQNEAYKFAMTEAMNAMYKDPVTPWRKAKRLGTFDTRDRAIDVTPSGRAAVARGHADEIGKLNADYIARQLATTKDELTGANWTPDELVALIRSGTDEEANKWYTVMRRYYENGRATFNRRTQTWGKEKLDLSVDENLKKVIEETQERLTRITGNHSELLGAVSQGRLKEVTVKADFIKSKDFKAGDTVVYKSGKRRLSEGRVESINESTGEVIIQPFAFKGGEATFETEQMLLRPDIYDNPNMPRRVVGEVIDPNTPERNQIKASLDRMVEMWHGHLYNEPIAKLERSPIFKELYYQWVDKLAVSLDSQSIDNIISDITARAASEGKIPENYIDPKTWKKLTDIQSGKIKNYGTINREELNAFASGRALDDMKKMFYDASERRNFTDMARIISPFGQQQAEFLARIGRTAFSPTAAANVIGPLGYLPNPDVLKKTQLIVSGATEADPDQNGRGFVYKDPVTGNMTFTIPLTGQLTKFLTGVESPLNAPVKGLALGFDYRPGLGPFATIAVSKMLPDMPRFDAVRGLLLPYGERADIASTLKPSWFSKLQDGLEGWLGGTPGSTTYMNTYVETMQALAATDEYDTSIPEERERLLEDARKKAGQLTLLRGIAQFIGPAAGSYDQVVKSNGMDIHASQLAKAFQEMKAQDYDTSVVNFINTFGEDAFVYLGNKSRSVVGGLESTKAFGDFQRENSSLFNQFKDVAGYFGPVGTDFDLAAYTRQLAKGQRVKLTPQEVLEASEQAIGLAFYRTMRADYPDTLNDEQQQFLANYRAELAKKYPGYGMMKFDPNKLPRQIEQLRQAASMKSLDGNNVAEGVRYYMKIRDAALAEAKNRGYSSFASKETADLRGYLSGYAKAIIEKYPEFARVYDRLLAQEVD